MEAASASYSSLRARPSAESHARRSQASAGLRRTGGSCRGGRTGRRAEASPGAGEGAGTQIIKKLLEGEWIQPLGDRRTEAPARPRSSPHKP